MPETAENVAAQFNVSRTDQDAFAVRSQHRWAEANRTGFFKGGDRTRGGGATKRTLKLVESRRATASRYDSGCTCETEGDRQSGRHGHGRQRLWDQRRRRRGFTCLRNGGEETWLKSPCACTERRGAGVAPRIMGFGPSPATRKILEKTGLKLEQFQVIELNEAFSAQVLAVTRDLGLPDDDARVNPNGGAIAIGHPLGASGVRFGNDRGQPALPEASPLRALHHVHRRRPGNCPDSGKGVAHRLYLYSVCTAPFLNRPRFPVVPSETPPACFLHSSFIYPGKPPRFPIEDEGRERERLRRGAKLIRTVSMD